MKTLTGIVMSLFQQLMSGRSNLKSHSFHHLHSLGRGVVIVVEEYDYSAR